ncbi:MAG TPA: 50S ribosomal protein L17 [Candidatus Paceibacterota bacterium]|nr:50S ribosomal protein L17 [Candidatus Paceibacterota bacterium]
MKHHKRGRTLGKSNTQRAALLKSLSRSLVLHGKIKTTEAKAKELRPFVERLVTYGKKGGLSAERLLIARIGGKDEAKKILTEIAPRYKGRNGGYTRIVKLPRRLSDSAAMAQISFV